MMNGRELRTRELGGARERKMPEVADGLYLFVKKKPAVRTGKMPTDVGGTLAGQILRVLVH